MVAPSDAFPGCTPVERQYLGDRGYRGLCPHCGDPILFYGRVLSSVPMRRPKRCAACGRDLPEPEPDYPMPEEREL